MKGDDTDTVDQQPIPALVRLPQLLLRLGLFNTYKTAEKQIKRGNIYAEINGDTPERAYWIRLDEVEAFICIPNETRIKYIDEAGALTIVAIRPHTGRDRTS